MTGHSPRHAEVVIGSAHTGVAGSPVQSAGALDVVLGGAVGIRSLSVLPVDAALDREHVRLLINAGSRLSSLRSASLRSLAGRTPPDTGTLVELDAGWRRMGLRVSIDYLLDASADPLSALGGRPSAMTHILEHSAALMREGVTVRWLVPLIPELVFRLESLFSLATDEHVDAVLTDPQWLRPSLVPVDRALDCEERRFALDFLTYRLLQEERHRITACRAERYRAMQAALALPPGEAGPPGAHRVAVIQRDASSPGDSWIATIEERVGLVPPPSEVAAGKTKRWWSAGPGISLSHSLDVGRVLLEGSRGGWQWLRTVASGATRRIRRETDTRAQLRTVLVIGAYGGDHIGDAAICGGVLLRLHEEHGVTRAIVMSQRPDHTRRLMGMLETPVRVTVEPYTQHCVMEVLDQVDAVVFGGGPLMDLPKQLVKHLFTASVAVRHSIPFFVEGIGAGPFVRATSAWIARRLMRLASRVTVRTSTDQEAHLMRGVDVGVGKDPAFDYLETRGAVLTRILPRDREWIQSVLRDTKGRRVIGINLRPIRHEFTMGSAPGKRAEYTRWIESRFEERVADALRRTSREAATPPCVVFFPMNAIQFGMSDLRSAYRIKRLLRSDVDLRIWEGDPSLDGIVELLRHLDIVVTMRFHAAIFALSQLRRVVGIDYRVGVSYKVAALLRDAGRIDNCARIDEMTSEWLYHQLSAKP